MWFFMNTCYVLSLFTFMALILAFTQSIFHFPVLKANHLTFMILTSILYSFTETLVIFFFVGTGVSIKEYVLEHKIDSDYHRRSIAIKRRVYPPLLLNILFMVILFVLAGAVDTKHFPLRAYQIIFLGCLYHFIKIKIIEHNCFKDNTRIILEMSNVLPG